MTLVVIDMQPLFSAAYHKQLRTPILREIARAKRLQRPVIVVEYETCGNTHDWITKRLKGYQKYKKVIKANDDGGEEILKCIKRHKFSKSVRICGVNYDACVKDTAETLSLSCKVKVVKKACSTDSKGKIAFQKHPNLKIV